MKRKIAIAAIFAVLVLGAAVLFQSLNAPVASPNSPAIGAWRKGGLSFVLKSDGTGQELHGKKPVYALKWTEKNGFVTIVVNATDTGMEMEYVGQLSNDKKTLHVTQTRAKIFPLNLMKKKVNWVLNKRPS